MSQSDINDAIDRADRLRQFLAGLAVETRTSDRVDALRTELVKLLERLNQVADLAVEASAAPLLDSLPLVEEEPWDGYDILAYLMK